MLASNAIASLRSGRIDRETTCNIGLIEGGNATNVVPAKVTVTCEVRSHDNGKLDAVTMEMIQVFRETVEEQALRSTEFVPL